MNISTAALVAIAGSLLVACTGDGSSSSPDGATTGKGTGAGDAGGSSVGGSGPGTGGSGAVGTGSAGGLDCNPPPAGAATLFVAPNGDDAGGCTEDAPCASFDRAYQVAAPGDIVEIAGGTYPYQVIGSRDEMRNLDPGCTRASPDNCVVFRPSAGQTVNLDGPLEVRGSSLWFRGTASGSSGWPTRDRTYDFTVRGYVDTEANSDTEYPDHVVFEGIDALSIGAFNVDTITFKDMDVGPTTYGNGCSIVEGTAFENKVGLASGAAKVPNDVTFDGLFIHDHNRNQAGADSDCHTGGLFIVTVDGLTVRRSVFSQNAVYNVQIQNFAGPPPKNVTFENNGFGCPVGWLYAGDDDTCDGQADVQFNAASLFSGFLFRYNSFSGGIGQYVPGASYDSVRIVANAGSGPSDTLCAPGVTFGFNAWDASPCPDADDLLLGALPFVGSQVGAEDFHLTPGSPAVDHVTAADGDYAMDVDADGESRPAGRARDAGADEALGVKARCR